VQLDQPRIAIELKNISKRLGASNILESVSLTIAEGECLAVFGPSGCGKTTLLRILSGLETPDWGEVRLGGRLMSSPTRVVPPYQRSVGLVFQDLALWPHMTAWKNIQFGLDKAIRGRKQRQAKIASLLELVKLRHLGDAYPHQLSGGEQQRLAIARALGQNSKILLLDEPLASLDATLKQELLAELRSILRSLNITIVYVTHDEDEARVIAQRIMRMKDGRIESIDPIQSTAIGAPEKDHAEAQNKPPKDQHGKVIRFVNRENRGQS